jgi:A/G-specific adenine glycosylase
MEAQSNRTVEGTEVAGTWVGNHEHMLPVLARIFQQYYRAHGRDFGWRRTDDAYAIWVSEMLLQKTSSAPVEAIWASIIQKYPDVMALANASVSDIQSVVAPLGLQKRARRLHESARIIAGRSGHEIPSDAAFLHSLPGVGKYTAAAVMSFGFGLPVATIDVNAARVYGRIAGLTPRTLRQGLAFADVVGDKVIAFGRSREVNYGLLDLAAAVCRPKPRCDVCPARSMCAFATHQLVASANGEKS